MGMRAPVTNQNGHVSSAIDWLSLKARIVTALVLGKSEGES